MQNPLIFRVDRWSVSKIFCLLPVSLSGRRTKDHHHSFAMKKEMLSPTIIHVLLSTMSRRKTAGMDRKFQFVPYGESFVDMVVHQEEERRPTISCDGRVPGGVTLELTHWTGNETPDHLYADTSTEMALRLASIDDDDDDRVSLDRAHVLNNHYDTDGVLSVWACLHPEKALKYKDLLCQGAEAGDFGEWPSDRGLLLNFIVENFARRASIDEAQAYEMVLPKVESILQDLTENNGNGYREMWESDFDNTLKSWQDFCDGKISLTRGPGKMVLVHENDADGTPMDCHALDKALKETRLWADTTRILRCNNNALLDDGRGIYRYEKIGHGWVQRLVTRPVVPAADSQGIVNHLNAACGAEIWKTGGSGLTAICRSVQGVAIDASPEEVMQQLYEADPGAQ